MLTVATVGFRAAQEPVGDTASVENQGDRPRCEQPKGHGNRQLSDRCHGPRLTGSANIKRAGDWSVERMKEWAHRRRPRAVACRSKRPERRLPVRLDERQVLSRGDAATGVSDSRHAVGMEPGHERARSR